MLSSVAKYEAGLLEVSLEEEDWNKAFLAALTGTVMYYEMHVSHGVIDSAVDRACEVADEASRVLARRRANRRKKRASFRGKGTMKDRGAP